MLARRSAHPHVVRRFGLAREPRVVRIRGWTPLLRRDSSSQRLRDQIGIVAQRVEQLLEHLGDFVFAAIRSISAWSCSWLIGPLPLRFERPRLPQASRTLGANLRVRDDRRQGWLGAEVLLRPDAVIPVDLLDRLLRRDALLEGSVRLRRS